MKSRWLYLLVFNSVCVAAIAQQTPPIQPKTVDTPKLAPLDLTPPPGVQQIANSPLSVEEAVRIALAHQPQITISKAGAEAAHGQVVQANSFLNPALGLTANAVKNQTFRGGNGSSTNGSDEKVNVNTALSLNQLIFDFNRTRDQVRQASAVERAALRDYDQTVQDVALQVKQAFYSLLQAKQQVKVDTSNVASRQSQVNLTQAQLNAGLGAPADLVNAKTLLSQATLHLLQANQQAVAATITLAQAMGIDPRTPLVQAEPPSPTPSTADSNALVDLSLKQRPEILAAQESLRASGYGVSVARKANLPSLDFGAGVSAKGAPTPFDSQVGFLSLTLNWTLLDGGLRTGRIETAEAQRKSSTAQLLQISQNVISEVSKAFVSLKAAEQQVEIAGAEVSNASEGVRLAEGRYKAGVTTFQEVITAQAELVTAQTDQVNSVAALAIAQANLDHAIGASITR